VFLFCFLEKQIKFAIRKIINHKLCQKEHFNPQIEKEKINTVLWIECLLLMDKILFLEEELKAEQD
jgi:hypothetical protein